MTRARTLARLALLCGVLSPVGACAVLEISVDVYKGPLANHEDVQIEQMAAMAIGAKPLLIELRDRLEWPESNQAERMRQEPGIRRWYKADFVPPPRPPVLAGMWFEKSQAQRVNAVLFLYKDKDLSGLEPLLEDFRDAKVKYNLHLDILEPNPVEDNKFWESIKAGFKEELSGDLKKLKTRYRRLLYPNHPDSRFRKLRQESGKGTKNQIRKPQP